MRCPLPPLNNLQRSGDEVLYVRPDAVFNKSKPISGGLPHCFPQVSGFHDLVLRVAYLLPAFTCFLMAA